MPLPNHILADHLVDENGERVLNYYSLVGGDGHVSLEPDELLASNTGAPNYGESNSRNLEPFDGALRVIQIRWDDVAGMLSLSETSDGMAHHYASPNGYVFIGEFPREAVSVGSSSQDSDFREPAAEMPVIDLSVRGGATAFHGRGQVFVCVVLKSRPSPDVSHLVASTVIDSICATLGSLDPAGTLGRVSNIPEVPGIWVGTDTANPRKVGVAGGQAHMASGDDSPCDLNVMALVNLDIDLKTQDASIIPCGLADSPLVDLRTAGFSIGAEEFRVALGKRLLEDLRPLHIQTTIE